MYLKQLIIALLVIGFSACASDSQQTAEETAPRKKEILKSAKMPKKASQRNDNAAKAITTSGNGRINWLKIEDLEMANKKEKRKVLVDLYTDWCGWCKRLDKSVFHHQEFKDWAKKNVVLLELDFPRRFQVPAYIKEQNSNLQRAFGVSGFPTIWLFDLKKDDAGQFNVEALGKTGYTKTVAEFTDGIAQMMARRKKG